MKALVVEDEKKIASFVCQGLEERGFVVDVCHRGDDGFELATTRRYDVVLLDIMLPDDDGWELLQALKRAPATRPIPVIICSVLGRPAVAIALGADAYLQKPVDGPRLVATLTPYC